MGHRTLKRVSLDFQWPLNKVWKGYINSRPGPRTCVICDGSGYNAATKRIADEFYDFDGDGSRMWCDNITQDEVQALVDANRLWNFTRVPLNDKQKADVKEKMAAGRNSWLPYDNGRVPTADEVNEWNRKRHGHDAINRWILIEARAKRLGVFGTCPKCNGKGSKFPAHVPHRPYKSWRECEPPIGAGYQLWETTSEGSPVSPVFASAEELADWCATGAAIFADERTSRENWLQMFVGEKNLEAGSMLIGQPGFFGAQANAPM